MDHAAPASLHPSHPEDLAWVILLLPLLSAVAITLGLRRSRTLTTTLAVSAVGTSFLLSVALFFVFGLPGLHAAATPLRWLSVAGLEAHIGLKVDALSSLMLMIVTGISFLVHVYSTAYMGEDRDYPRYF